MELRPPQFHGIVELMLANISPTFRALSTAAFQFADGFLQLHASGLCYRDISFGNAFINADTGDVLICDNDNVGIDGRAPVGVRGTDLFMAPEVARGDALPSTATDLYSLSVLLFHLFMVHHPLVGGRELGGNLTDQDADHKMYAEDPLFIWDPVDDSNRPVPGVHQNAIVYWKLYPTFLRQLFTQAFTSGLSDPLHGRVREGEWRAAALRLRDAIYYCGACGQENFWDAETSPGFCWSCRRQLEPPPRLVSSRYVVLLNSDTKLFAHHLAGTSGDFSREMATVVRHPSQPDVWGLRNLSGWAWHATTTGGSSFTVEPGRSCTLADGSQLDFGQIQATIRT
jgi:serine/threonine protein kinase